MVEVVISREPHTLVPLEALSGADASYLLGKC